MIALMVLKVGVPYDYKASALATITARHHHGFLLISLLSSTPTTTVVKQKQGLPVTKLFSEKLHAAEIVVVHSLSRAQFIRTS